MLVPPELTKFIRLNLNFVFRALVDQPARRRLSRPACRFEDTGRPPARRPPRPPAGARGDDRYRSGRRPPAAQDRERARQVAEKPAAESQTSAAGDLDGRKATERLVTVTLATLPNSGRFLAT